MQLCDQKMKTELQTMQTLISLCIAVCRSSLICVYTIFPKTQTCLSKTWAHNGNPFNVNGLHIKFKDWDDSAKMQVLKRHSF